jgi:ferritin-like metal-binding protein YciE
MKTLKDLFLNELADIYDAEQRIAKALPKMAKACTCEDLRSILESHLDETVDQVDKLKEVFEQFGETPKGKKCEATAGLLQEAEEVAATFKGSPALDAALIAACQKVEHYEMATYGCLFEWAEVLGNSEAAGLLEDILEEEKAANVALNELAHSRSNLEALGEEDDSKEVPSKPAKSASKGKAVKVG